MAQRRSISQILRKGHPIGKKREITQEWAENKKTEYENITTRLGLAVRDDDFDELCILVGLLKESNKKLFDALPSVINLIFDAPKIEAKIKIKKDMNDRQNRE